MKTVAAHLSQKVIIFTTPAELREIADDLERRFVNCTIGRDLPRFRFYGPAGGPELVVEITLDQDRMGPRRKGVADG